MYIYKAGVVGAGQMGAEIAQVITFAGLPVVIKDVNQELVDKGLKTIRTIYDGRVKKGKMTTEDVEKKMALVSGTTDMNAFKEVDIVIEAVPEKMELKKKVFQEIQEVLPESAIMATNTSALSISELASATKRPSRVVGMHFFYPAHVMKLVEVIPGLATDDEVVSDVIAFAESLRKISVRVNECAGFLVNRLLMPYLNEAAYCLQEGAATVEEIDQAAVQFGLPMGPFTLVDNLGLDVCYEVVQVLLGSYGIRMKPAELWMHFYDAKRFGRKTGGGFFPYTDTDPKAIETLIKKSKESSPKKGTKFSIERLIYPMINEAALCVEENVATAADIDLSMIAGVGFPQDKQGILHYADQVGLDKVLAGLEEFHSEHGDRFWPAPRLRRQVGAKFLGKASGRGFFEYST